MESLNDRINRWAMDLDSPDGIDDYFLDLRDLIDYLAKKLYSEYLPTTSPSYSEFNSRLEDWVNNVPDEDFQKLLLRLVPKIFFVGPQELTAMYRVALNGHIERWLIDTSGVSINEVILTKGLDPQKSETWFCSITDITQFQRFCQVNKLKAIKDYYSLEAIKRFADIQRIGSMLSALGIKRIVIVEDFLGKDTQSVELMNFVLGLPKSIQILLCPMIACPHGVDIGLKMASKHANLTFKPVLQLHTAAFVSPAKSSNDDDFITELRHLLMTAYPKVDENNSAKVAPFGPFGFDETGSLIVLFYGCPKHSLPIIHHESKTWKPLFPKSSPPLEFEFSDKSITPNLNKIIDFVEGLTETDFERILTRMPSAAKYVSGGAFYQRVGRLFDYINSSNGPGMQNLLSILKDLFPDKVPS